MTSENLQRINWQEIELETVNAGMQRRIVTGEKMTVARIYFDDGFTVPMHSHHNEQITQILKGQMHFVFGGDDPKEMMLGPGDVVVIPADVPHQATGWMELTITCGANLAASALQHCGGLR